MLRLFVITNHPLAATAILRLLHADAALRTILYPQALPDLAAVPRDQEALLLVDTSSIARDATEAWRVARARNPGLRCLMLAPPAQDFEDSQLHYLRAGVDGCAALGAELDEILPRAVRAILEGQLWYAPTVLRRFVQQSTRPSPRHPEPDLPLTTRERQVFRMMERRLSNKEIASELNISERTAKFHVSNVFAKLRIHDRRAVSTRVGENSTSEA